MVGQPFDPPLMSQMFMMLNRLRTFYRWAATGLSVVGISILAADPPATNVLRMHFSTNSAGETLVRYGESNPSTLKPGSEKQLNVSQHSSRKGAQFTLVPDDAQVAVSSEQFPGWSAQLPPKQSMAFGFDYPKGQLDLSTPDRNLGPVNVQFGDGAKVEMNPLAFGRLEVMDDGAYAFFGSGALTGVNADGGPVRFGPVFPPLFGGKLIAPQNTNGGRFTRTTPVTQLSFIGQIDSGLQAKVGERIVPLEKGVAQEVKLENGANVSLLLNPTTHAVEWTVNRGLVRFTVDSFVCWKALGTSGQSASMQWDTNGFLMELKNKNGPGAFQKTILVNLSPYLNVAVGESASFQYGRTGDCSTFVASAHGGETTLYNAQNGRYVRLDEGNMNVISGNPDTVGGDAVKAPRTHVKVGWNKDNAVEINGGTEVVKVPIGGEDSFSPNQENNLKINNRSKEELVLKVDTGSFGVTPDILPNISLELGEGTGIAVGYEYGAEVLRVQALDSNVNVIGLRTATGFYPRIEPGTKMTFVINRSTFIMDQDQGALIFSETAGAGAPTLNGSIFIPPLLTGRGNVTFLGGAPELNAPRIEQPPVTTLE